MRAIIRGGHFSACVRCWTRHASPVPFTHIVTEGVAGRGALAAIDPNTTGLFVFGHPTLGDWASIPALAKTPEGGALHSFNHPTPPDPMTAEAFAELHYLELFVRGHIRRYGNGERADGVPIVGLQLDDATLLDSIRPALVAFRSDTMTWDEVPDEYKNADGSPRIDTGDVVDTSEVRWAA